MSIDTLAAIVCTLFAVAVSLMAILDNGHARPRL
jgi:hypothetical protein